MDVVAADCPYPHLEKDIRWHSISCLCPGCRLADMGVGFSEPFRKVTFSPGSKPGMTYTGIEIIP